MANRIVFFSAYVAAATAFMTACSPVYHVPATQNVPLLMEKGQGRVAAFSDGGSAEIQGSLIFDNEDQVQYLKDHPSQLVLEPALTLRAGLDWGKIQLQYAHSINLSDDTFRQSEGHLTIGLIFAFLNGGR